MNGVVAMEVVMVVIVIQLLIWDYERECGSRLRHVGNKRGKKTRKRNT